MVKRLILLIVAVLLILCGCGRKNNQVTNTKKSKEDVVEKEDDKKEAEDSKIPDNEEKNEEKQETVVNETTAKTETKTENKPSSNSTNKQEQQPQTNPEAVGTPLENIKGNFNLHKSKSNGFILDWFVEGELVYTIFRDSNKFVIFDTDTAGIVMEKPLEGRPAKIRQYGNELWISFPDLKCVNIYDKQTFAQKRSIVLEEEISSFDIYNNYLFYSEDEQHVDVFRYNMETGENTLVWKNGYYIEILVDSTKKVFYIADTKSTGSAIVCFDVETLVSKSSYYHGGYGYLNMQRRMYLQDGYIYWGEFKLDALRLDSVKGRYRSLSHLGIMYDKDQYPGLSEEDMLAIFGQYAVYHDSGMLYVNDQYVITTHGLFNKSTYERIAKLTFMDIDKGIALAITKTGNIFAVDGENLYIASQK